MSDDISVTARKFRWRPRFGIGARITSLPAVAVAGLLAVAGLHMYSDAENNSAADSAHQYARLSSVVARVESGVLQMRRYEKDFSLRHEDKYADLYGAVAQDALARLEEIEKLPVGGEVAPLVIRIRKKIEDHADIFRTFIELNQRLGYSEADGLHIVLREAVHKLEAVLDRYGSDALTVAMLMMRRHEKDFVMRGKDIYIERFDRQYEAFYSLLPAPTTEIQGHNIITHTPEITRLMDQYAADFRAYVETYRREAVARRLLVAIHAEIDPPLDAMLTYALTAHSRAESNRLEAHESTRAIVVSAGILILAGLLIFEFLLARNITGGITKLNRTMVALAGGDTAIDIPSSGKPDEIGDVARALIVFRENMIERDSLVAARDAEHERTEQQLRQLTLSRSKFFAAASHDLRQPLHAVSLYLPALEEEANGGAPGDAIRAIRSACDTMDTLLNTLLDISKLDSSTIEPKIGSVPIADIFDQLAMEFAPQAAARSLELRVVPTSAWGVSDATLLLRILRNLLVNAIRYTPDGKVLLGVRRRAGRLHLEVHDTGIGIAAGDLRKIFGEFYQIGGGSSDRDRSLGLGLSIVERLAHLLDHRIDVRSRPGDGSVFSVELQQAEAPALREVGEDLAQILQRNMAGLRVVLVEDNTAVLEGMEILLGRWGCEVLAADTVAGAVAGVASGAYVPDIILADLQLRNGETGLQAIECIRDAAEFPVPAIIITATTDPDGLREAVASGCKVMHKPLKPDQLRTAMETTLPQPCRESRL